MFDFFHGGEIEQYIYYTIPQILFTNSRYKKMSCEAKLLYGLLLDRVSLSNKNNWIDEKGLFIYFTQEEVCDKLNISRGKAVKVFSELDKIGLICRKKQGLGKPAKIYVLNITKDIKQPSIESQTEEKHCEDKEIKIKKSKILNFKTSQKRTSRLSNFEPLDFQNLDTINTNNINTNNTNNINNQSINQTDRLIDKYEKCKLNIQEQIGYDTLLKTYPGEINTINCIVDIMLEVYNSKDKFIFIQKQSLSRMTVQQQFEKLDIKHIEYILECLQEETKKHKIKNLRKYILTCLYNAPFTIDFHCKNEITSDIKTNKKKNTSYDIDEFEKLDMLDILYELNRLETAEAI